MIVVWACDVIGIMLGLYCFPPLKAAAVRVQDKQRWLDDALLEADGV